MHTDIRQENNLTHTK